MLVNLIIENVVLIERVRISFDSGLCVLTGETGAGKSILLDSLGLALGGRSDSSLVRKGAEKAVVSAEFCLPEDHVSNSILSDAGIDAGEGCLILRRVVTADGRSRAFINDNPVSVSLLKKVGASLLEIHGQFETQGLLNRAYHREMLDEYGGVLPDVRDVARLWHRWKDTEKAYREAVAQMEQDREDEEFLRSSIDDLQALDPKEGEEEKLTQLRNRLMGSEQIIKNLKDAASGMWQVEKAMGDAWKALERIGDDVNDIVAAMDRASAEVQEVVSMIRSFSADMEDCRHSLPEVDERLFSLKSQARKHGCGVDDLPAKLQELIKRLDQIEYGEDALLQLEKDVERAKADYVAKARELSRARIEAGSRLDRLVNRELPPLKLERARFVTRVERLDEEAWSENGIDRVAFEVSTNPNTSPGDLKKVASGGELSRFMLALKVVMAEVGSAGTLVFDEVDSGIGGSTAAAVGERLYRLSRQKQVLLVTHSPQVAAMADFHWIVKKGGQDIVVTEIIPLEDRQKRQEEIARMLSAAEITDEARLAAGKLMERGK